MKNNSNFNSAIMISSIAIATSLFYLGSQISNNKSDVDLGEQIEAGINSYVEKQQAEAAKNQAEANKPQIVDGDFTDNDAILGDKNAPVTLIEFSDYECPFCKRHFTQTYPQIKEKYINTGKVKMIFRDFPLSFHDPLASQEAMAAECVRDQKGDETYFAYHNLLFENTTSNGQGMKKEKLYELAEQVGANKAEFTTCLDSEKFKDEVQKDLADGQKAGISGTPGFLINGQLISGAQPFSMFESIIEAELAK